MYTNEAGEVVKKKFSVVKMVNASGAGDACMAAIIYGTVNDLKIEKTISYALAAGKAAIRVKETTDHSHRRQYQCCTLQNPS